MAVMPDNFNANTTPPASPREPLPKGRYLVNIIESERSKTNDQTGEKLTLVLEVLEGEHKGRRIYKNLNIKNKSAQAQAIALGELSAVCRAVNVMNATDSCDLHKLPFYVDVVLKKNKQTEDMQNEIRAFYNKTAGVSPSGPASPGSNAPWKK